MGLRDYLHYMFKMTSPHAPRYSCSLLSAVQQRLCPSLWVQQSELPERVLPAQGCLQAAV